MFPQFIEQEVQFNYGSQLWAGIVTETNGRSTYFRNLRRIDGGTYFADRDRERVANSTLRSGDIRLLSVKRRGFAKFLEKHGL